MDTVVDPLSMGFVDKLVREFGGDVRRLRMERSARRRDPRGYLGALSDLQSPAAISNPAWRVSPPPAELLDRRVEITGPGVDPRMAITALNSGACGYMVDGEDSMSPTWQNVLGTQATLWHAVRRSLTAENGGRKYVMNDRTAVLHYRPRGLHLDEVHWRTDGMVAPASIVDAGLFLWHNARELMSRGSGAYLYLPKLESPNEARFWGRLLSWIEDELGMSHGVIRTTVLIETLPALVRVEDIVWALRTRLVGLNVGRWDYIFSMIKMMSRDSEYVLPDRGAMTMESPELAEYARWVVRVAHMRGAHAIGGMAAAVPSRKDPMGAVAAMAAVKRDKEREARAGHDGTWVAHPDLVSVAMEAFEGVLGEAVEQRSFDPGGGKLDIVLVKRAMSGPRTEAGLREAVRSALVYIDAWLGGNGCVAMDGKMEDAATAEISRALLWQWVARRVVLEDGTLVDANRVTAVVRGEAAALAAAGTDPRAEAVELVQKSVVPPEVSEFIISDAYDVMIRSGLTPR